MPSKTLSTEKPWWDTNPRKGPAAKAELETKVEQRFVRAARKRGWKCRKLNGAGARDWHDQLVLAPNVVCLIEFKRPDGKSKLSPGQEVHHDETIALGLGAYSLVTDSSDVALKFVEELCAATPKTKRLGHDPLPARFRPKATPPISTKKKR